MHCGYAVTGIFLGTVTALSMVCILSDHPLISQETSGTFVPHFKALVCMHNHILIRTHVFGSSCSDIQLVGKTVVLLEGRIVTQYRTKIPQHFYRYIILYQKRWDKGNTCEHMYTHTHKPILTDPPHTQSLTHKYPNIPTIPTYTQPYIHAPA